MVHCVECGPMANVMAALPLLRSSADTGERKAWTQSEFCIWQNSVREHELPKRIGKH